MKKTVFILLLIIICKVLIAQNDTLQNSVVYKQFYFNNGNISSEGYLKNNKPTGFWKSYYITGLKRSEGNWFNNRLDSVWIFYNQLGDTTIKINYYQGTKNGYQYKYFTGVDKQNIFSSKELYVNGKRNDKSYFYYQTSEIKKTVPFLDDKKHGIAYEYNRKGEIITIIRYRNNEIIVSENINRYNSENNKDGVWKEFYNNGNIKKEKSYLNGKLNGYTKIYNENGKLLDAIKYENGEVDLKLNDQELNVEIKEEYDKNENLVFTGTYKKNIPIGIHRYFNKKGDVIKSITYNIYGKVIGEGKVLINGNNEGDWIVYYDNGKKREIGKYSRGKKHGKWTYYYKNERVQQLGSYVNGKLSGSWRWYYETGELLREELYLYGQQDGEAIEYSELGNIISQGNYIEGYKEGEWIYVVGDQKYNGKYILGNRDGEWKSYYLEKETLCFRGKYLQGNPEGKHIYYYPDESIKEERYYNEGEKVKSWSKYNKNGDLILVVQYRDGKEYKINGVRLNRNSKEN